MNIILLIVYIIIINKLNFGKLIYEKSSCPFPHHPSPCFLFLSPLRLPQGFFLLLSAIVLYNKIKDGGRDIRTLKRDFHSPPICTPALPAGYFPAFSTTIITLLSLLWVLLIYHSLSLPEFKISKQWRPGLSAV